MAVRCQTHIGLATVPRNTWRNFVSSSKERIEQARQEWKTGRFDVVPVDEEEYIPLPEGWGTTRTRIYLSRFCPYFRDWRPG